MGGGRRQPPAATQAVLAARGVGGYRQYRIPALAVTTAGTVLAAYDARPTLDDLPAPIDLVLRRSPDGGATWQGQRVLRTGPGLEGFGDPSLLVDRTTGRVFCFHAATTRWGFFESEEGTERTQHVDVSVSDDEGLTWRHRRLTTSLKGPGVRGIFAASGAGAQVPSGPYAGRLLQPCVVLLATGRIAAAVARSDDHGDTWALGGPLAPAADGTHTNESSVAVLPDGTVLLHSRATPHRLVARSADGGATFTVPVPEPALPDPSDNGCVLALGSGLVATHNAHRHLRRNTVVRHSPDGASWAGAVVLCAGASGYSTAAELPDGSVGVLYERGAYEEIVFARVPRAALEARASRPGAAGVADGAGARPARVGPDATGPAAPGQPGPCPVPGAPDLVAEVVPRSITPAPPARWVFTGDHAVLGGADSGYGPAGKEVGQAGAQVVATRADLLANYGPARPGIHPGDTVTYSAAVTNAGTSPVRVRPQGAVDGPAQAVAPGATAVWPHLNHRVSGPAPRPAPAPPLEWEVLPG